MSTETMHGTKFTLPQSVAVVLLSSIPTLSVFAMPFMLGGLVDRYHLPASTMAWAITIELILGSLGALVVTLRLERLNPRIVASAAVVCMALSQLGTIFAPDVTTLFILRGILGFGEGLCVSLASGAIARAAQARRLYSIQGVVIVALTLAVFAGLPALAERSGSSAVFVALAMLNIVLLPAPLFLSNQKVVARQLSGGSVFDRGSVVLLLVALLAASASNGAWLYFEQIGEALHLRLGEIVNISLVTTATALVAPWLALRSLGRTSGAKPLAGWLILQGIAVFIYAGGYGVPHFVISALLLNAGIIFVQVYLLGMGAAHDPTGKTSAALGGVMSYLAVICGTTASSLAVGEGNNFLRFGIFDAVLFVLAAMTAVMYRRSLAAAKAEAPLSGADADPLVS